MRLRFASPAPFLYLSLTGPSPCARGSRRVYLTQAVKPAVAGELPTRNSVNKQDYRKIFTGRWRVLRGRINSCSTSRLWMSRGKRLERFGGLAWVSPGPQTRLFTPLFRIGPTAPPTGSAGASVTLHYKVTHNLNGPLGAFFHRWWVLLHRF